MRRLFIAADPPEEAKTRLATVISELRERVPRGMRVTWTRPEQFHLTLKFLGSVEEPRLEDIQVALGKLVQSEKSFTGEIAGYGVFPPKGSPKVLWAGVRGEGLSALAARIDRAMEGLGFSCEAREFSPHLTLGRVKEGRAGNDLLAGLTPLCEIFPVLEIILYESRTLPEGALYRPLASFKLSG